MQQAEADQLLDQILDSPQLPSLPAVALEVVELVQRPDISIDALAETLARDPALASRLLKTVNSSFYAQARTITTIRQAVVIMGLNSVRTLALGFSLVDGLNRSTHEGFDHEAFWARSLRSAVASRTFAVRFAPSSAEEAFLGGLLGRLGVLAMAGVLRERYHPVFAAAADDLARLGELEQAEFGISHSEVGARLANRWNLPLELSAAFSHIAEPSRAPAGAQDFVRLVAIGDTLAGLFGDAAGRSLQLYRRCAADWFDLYPEQADELVTEVADTAGAMLKLFELGSRDSLSPAEILGRANEALAKLSLDAAQQSSRLAAENEELSIQASIDPLTNVSNRRRFDESLAEQTAIAGRYRGDLSLLLLDLDDFKQVNDQFGHRGGDRVLVEVGRVLLGALRDADLAARYGGEEFTVILPATDLEGATEVAERLRRAIAALQIQHGQQLITVTVSIGVAQAASQESAESLVARADRAVYLAKDTGRDRVTALPRDLAA